jgi:hypothetical protein
MKISHFCNIIGYTKGRDMAKTIWESFRKTGYISNLCKNEKIWPISVVLNVCREIG